MASINVTDEGLALEDPELAVLLAMAHGQDLDADKVLRIAVENARTSIRKLSKRINLFARLSIRRPATPTAF